MRVLQIGADRSKRGILAPDSPASLRQQAYARTFGQLDVIGFSLARDSFVQYERPHLRVRPTNSTSRLRFGMDALRIARTFEKPDVVSAQDPFETGLVAWLIARRFGVPLHIQVHTDFLAPEYGRQSRLHWLRVRIAGFVLRRAARVRVVSQRIKQSIERRYHLATPITVLPIFVDIDAIRGAHVPEELRLRFAAFKTKILIVSRLEPEKNVLAGIESFARAEVPGSCLIIVGSGSQELRLWDVPYELNIPERVFFERETTAAPYYHIADLVLVPSSYEGYGLVIVEALAAGKPVMSRDVGVAREAGARVIEGDIADGLKEWYADGSRKGELRSYPYEHFENYVRAYCADIEAAVR